jgi:polar amino acid transport system substrate-binding protein
MQRSVRVGSRAVRPYHRLGIALLAAGLGLAGGAACGWPRDPEGTLARVSGGVLRVGVSSNPPWVIDGGATALGVEPELVRGLAAGLGAQPQWSWGSPETQLRALESFELDLVIGGLHDDTPWRDRVALTRPYYAERTRVGAPPGSAVHGLRGLRGLRVQVERGRPAAAWLLRAGALPLRVLALDPAGGPLAAPHWQLEAWGLAPLGDPLHEARHVLALPPGENAWLVHLERFLAGRRAAVDALLRASAR